jgi:hypothetical protein
MMSESKHTPGPWHWLIHDHSCASLGVGDDPGMGTPLVMSVSPCRSCADRARDGEWKWGRCTTPSEADARLIAAAPDLLDALIELKEWIENDCGAECPSDKARAALAKAETR